MGGKRFFIIRFSRISRLPRYRQNRYYRFTGIGTDPAARTHGTVFITSERKLSPAFEPYRIAIKAGDIHHALYFADMFIGDSQTMTAEAAVLGTPAIRFNDFVGELGYLEDLEHNWKLTFGIPTSQPLLLTEKVKELLAMNDLKSEWKLRLNKMLKHKADFSHSISGMLACLPNDRKCISSSADKNQYQ